MSRYMYNVHIHVDLDVFGDNGIHLINCSVLFIVHVHVCVHAVSKRLLFALAYVQMYMDIHVHVITIWI